MKATKGLLTLPTTRADQVDERLLASLLAAAPATNPQIVVKDPASLARFLEQGALLRACLALAFVLCLAAFLITVIDARWQNRRSIAAQQVVGTPSRIIQVSAATQFAAPLIMASAVTVPICSLIADMFLSFWGAGEASSSQCLQETALLAAAAVVICAAAGWLIGHEKGNFQDLYRE
jgi:hypothetical protein